MRRYMKIHDDSHFAAVDKRCYFCLLSPFIFLCLLLFPLKSAAQELEVKVNINSSQIQGTDKSVFENLKETLEQWMNDRQWTELQFQKNERIVCNFNLTVTKYVKEENMFELTIGFA